VSDPCQTLVSLLSWSSDWRWLLALVLSPLACCCRDYPLDLRPLWLHARTYSCHDEGWSFSTELPEWAHADWVPCT
jgi:hypothetical protein